MSREYDPIEEALVQQAAGMEAKVTKAPVWEFLCQLDETYPHGDWMARYYKAPTIIQAATKMVKWLERQLDRDIVYVVDEEARACHLPHTSKHELYYPDLLKLDHPIREYI